MSRTALETRITNETKVEISLDLDGAGEASISTGVGFFDHLLASLAHHGLFDLTAATVGDLHIDDHHTVEDTALVLGTAFATALGDRSGLHRFGEATVPMDEAWAQAIVDCGGRPYTVVELEFGTERIGQLSTQNIGHAVEALSRTAGFTIHLRGQGTNDHHLAEAAFKTLGRALRRAVEVDTRRPGVASTKGALS